MLTSEGLREHEINWILDSHPRSRSYQFLVRWKGYGPEDDEWLMRCLLEDCEILNHWYESEGDGPSSAWYLPSRV
jgi:hypothetical protein